MMQMNEELKGKFYKVLKMALVAFVVVFAFNTFSDCLSNDNRPENTISFTGHGEVTAVPDIASVYFTISKDAKTVKEAQAKVAEIEKKALDILKGNNIALKDIKTTNASFSPKYDYEQIYCITYPCPTKSPVIVGYTASLSITVKIRNTDDAGKVIQELGTTGVSDLSGPNFSIDNEEGLKAQARKKAIDDAKAKASILARDLGVRLGKISSFSESGNYPIAYYAKGMMADSASLPPAPAELPKGENTISSDVTITYEIR